MANNDFAGTIKKLYEEGRYDELAQFMIAPIQTEQAKVTAQAEPDLTSSYKILRDSLSQYDEAMKAKVNELNPVKPEQAAPPPAPPPAQPPMQTAKAAPNLSYPVRTTYPAQTQQKTSPPPIGDFANKHFELIEREKPLLQKGSRCVWCRVR